MAASNGSNGVSILKFMALGRLAKGSSGGAIIARDLEGTADTEETKKTLGKHQILAYAAANKDDRTKVYKQHVKEVMSKGASRLTGGKRVRLTSDEEDESERYELNVLTEYIDGDPNLALVFFAITTPDFAKYQSISSLFKDLKTSVYDSFSSDQLAVAQSSGPLHSSLKPFFEQLFNKYNKSQLLQVTQKVESVKEIMKDNVGRALENVEHLEEMEVKAETMQNQARIFEREGGRIRWLMRCRYYKIMALIVLLVLALLAYLIFFIWSKTRSTSGPAPTPVGGGT